MKASLSGTGARALAGVAVATAVLVVSTGCPPLPLPVLEEFPVDGDLLLCTMTVRNPDGREDTRTNQDPGFEALFYVDHDQCIDDWGYSDVAEATSAWRRHAASKIASIDDFEGPWCELAASCSVIGAHTICTENDAGDAEPLAACPDDPPPPDVCFETLCGDPVAPCPVPLDFGDVAVGQSQVQRVTFRNCGEEGAPEVTVAPGPIEEVAATPLFDFEIQGNECVQDPDADRTLAAGEACELQVGFAPQEPGDHGATIGVVWTVAGEQQADDLALEGSALGGTLAFAAGVPDPLCVTAAAAVAVTVENTDAVGGVWVETIFVEPVPDPAEATITITTANTPEFFVAPEGQFTIDLSASFAQAGRTELKIRWGGVGDLDLVRELQYRPQCN